MLTISNTLAVQNKIKTALEAFLTLFLRGLKRIRTAVAAFAELCLATRPSDQFDLFECANIQTFSFLTKFTPFFVGKFQYQPI